MITITDNGNNSITFDRDGVESYLQKTKIVEVDVVNDGVMIRMKSNRTIRIDSYTEVSGATSANQLADDINAMLGGCPTITLADLSSSTAEFQQAYSDSVSPSGGTAPYNLSVTLGSLPTGLSLNTATGAITGTPTNLQSSNFTIGGTDADGCPVTPKDYTISVESTELNGFISRVQSAGSDITGGLLTAYEDFYSSVYGIKSKIKRLNLFAADTFAGIFEPLFNTGNVSDTNHNFVSGNWSMGTGLDGDGSTKYITTGLINSTHWPDPANISWGVHVKSYNAASKYEIGMQSETFYMTAKDSPGLPFTICHCNGDLVYSSESVGEGIFILSKTSTAANGLKLFKDGSVTSTWTSASTTSASIEFEIFRLNATYSDNGVGGYIFATGLTDSEVGILTTAWQNFNTAIGR